MWTLAIIFLIVVIIRYAIRAYQQQQILNEITVLETDIKASAPAKTVSEDGEVSKCQAKDAPEDYDEYSTGHNVTKILTAPGSRKLHLSQEQIEQGNKVNKELLEMMAKRKIHTE